MPLNCGVSIPEDDPVRLLNAVMERMDYRKVRAAYSRERRIEYSPKNPDKDPDIAMTSSFLNLMTG